MRASLAMQVLPILSLSTASAFPFAQASGKLALQETLNFFSPSGLFRGSPNSHQLAHDVPARCEKPI